MENCAFSEALQAREFKIVIAISHMSQNTQLVPYQKGKGNQKPKIATLSMKPASQPRKGARQGMGQSLLARSVAPVASGQLPPYVRLMADPIKGPLVARPDDNSTGSVMRRDTQVYLVGSTAAGTAAVSFGPGLYGTNHTINYTMSTDNLSTTTAASFPNGTNYTALSADFPTMRTLAYAIQVRYVAPEISSSGRLALVCTNDADILNTTLSTVFDNNESIVQKAWDGASAIIRPLKSPPFASWTTAAAGTLPIVHLVVVGAPASVGTLLEVTVVRVIEMLPAQASLRASDVVPCTCDMVSCCVAANISGSKASYGAGKDYGKLVDAGLKIAKIAFKAFSPPGYALGMSLLEAAINA